MYFSPKYTSATTRTQHIPSYVDLSPQTKPIRDQGSVGCCVSFTLCTAARYLFARNHNKNYLFSPLFLYYVTRVNEGESVRKDAGSTLKEGIRALKEYGVCQEKYWKFNKNEMDAKPTSKAFQDARKHRLLEYIKVSQNLTTIQKYLADGYLINVGLRMHKSFHKKKAMVKGKVKLPGRNEKILGYHAALLVGYNDKTQTFLVQNSWGDQVGDSGLFHLPYTYILDPDLCTELFCLLNF